VKHCYIKISLGLMGWILGSQIANGRSMDLKSAIGKVLIAAPTEINGPTNRGVWFIDPGSGSFSLDLPELPKNQVYEGWIVDDCTGKKFSTGLFRSTGGIDSDAAGKFAGPLALNFPQVPGSDFVTLGHNLVDGGHNVVVTVEPYPDSDPNPSGLAVLKVNIPRETAPGKELVFDNMAQ
jgi:hypothetical protein